MNEGQRFQITSVFRNEGTIVVFRAQALGRRFGRTRLIAVDHRPARTIAQALADGIRPIVEPESWQVMG